MPRWVATPLVVGLMLLVGYVGYRLVKADLTIGVYEDRLASLTRDYESLRGTYNEAVRRTAVTELVVRENQLSVHVRNAEGTLRVIETPFDPRREIYVDYAVIDSRLWIRRVFDAKTPPEQGVLIDPSLAEVDWCDQSAAHGKAVYRSLGEGRWVVSVSGDGSLSLSKANLDVPAQLTPPPTLGSYEEQKRDLEKQVGGITLGEVLKHLTGFDH